MQVIEYSNRRVLTTTQLANSMQTNTKIITQNFRRNKKSFEQGVHFFLLKGEELKRFKGSLQNEDTLRFTSVLYLWTEQGAWLHANSLNTEQARNAISALIDSYYSITRSQKLQESTKTHALVITYEQFQEIERRVEVLEQQLREAVTLHSGEQIRLRKAISARVYELTDEPGARQVLFRSLYAALKERYRVRSYRDIKQYQLQDALRFVANWGGK